MSAAAMLNSGEIMIDRFSKMHPITNLAFFIFIISFSMLIMNPICLLISLVCALINAIYLNGKRSVIFGLKFVLPTVILVSIINPVVNHEGVTIIEYLPWNNPLTLESIAYGLASAIMLSSVVFWFSSVNTVMTSDKFVYLFGRILPSLSLVLSMALRFVPRFNAQLKEVQNAQKIIGKKFEGGFIPRLKEAIKILSMMVSWSLENAIETSDSMKGRGYGLKGRTAFSIFKLTKSDIIFLSVLSVQTLILVILKFFGAAKFRYFPSMKGEIFCAQSVLFYIIYAAAMLMPFIINVGEELRWKQLRSAI